MTRDAAIQRMKRRYQSEGFAVVEKLVDPALREYLRVAMDVSHRAGLIRESENAVVNTSFDEYGSIVSESLLTFVQPDVERVVGEAVLPTYSYWRIYENGAILRRHVDRPACEVSVSLCVGAEPLGNTWPLCLVDLSGQEVVTELEPGSAVVYQGCRVAHWRSRFEGSVQYQLFMHYVLAAGEYASFAYDGRASVGQPVLAASRGSR